MIEVLGTASGTAVASDPVEMPWTDVYINYTVPTGTKLLLAVMAAKSISGETLSMDSASPYVRDQTSGYAYFTRLFSRSYGESYPGVELFALDNPSTGARQFRFLWEDANVMTAGLIALGNINDLVQYAGIDGVRTVNSYAGATGLSAEIDYSAQPGSDIGLFLCAHMGSGAITPGENQTTLIDKLASGSTFRMLATMQRLKIDNTLSASWSTSAAYAKCASVLANKRQKSQVIITG